MRTLCRLPWWLALLGLLASPAGAELFRCTTPDGQTVFTDKKGTCPGAEPFEPSGEVQSADTPSAPPPAARKPLADEAEAEQARLWRDKKRAAEEDLAGVQKHRDYLQQYVSFCNRGGYVTTRDDAGIKKRVNCSELRSEFNGLEEQEAAALDYLQNGLAEDCRKAGCLPGWIR
jgi:Domain of unknown function (DUF4124)